MKRIFVGGTGRSGTTILSQWLGSHSSVAKFPVESRFLIDFGGVMSLFNAVTRDYSMDQSRVTFREFKRLMHQDLVSPDQSPYQGIELASIFGPLYYDSLSKLESKLCIKSFDGWDYHTPRSLPRVMHRLVVKAGHLLNALSLGRSQLGKRLIYPAERMYAIRRLGREEAIETFGRFVKVLFDGWAESKGATGWCEDTPANACHLQFLMQLVPESRHFCIVRNPYGTTLSYMRQVWAPRDFSACVQLLASLYGKIIEEIESLEPEERVRLKIVRLEDLHYTETLDDVSRFADIRREDGDGSIRIRAVDQEQEKRLFPTVQRLEVERKLGFVMNYFGYNV